MLGWRSGEKSLLFDCYSLSTSSLLALLLLVVQTEAELKRAWVDTGRTGGARGGEGYCFSTLVPNGLRAVVLQRQLIFYSRVAGN